MQLYSKALQNDSHQQDTVDCMKAWIQRELSLDILICTHIRAPVESYLYENTRPRYLQESGEIPLYCYIIMVMLMLYPNYKAITQCCSGKTTKLLQYANICM